MEDEWTEIVPQDALTLRLFCGIYLLFPLLLLLVGFSKLRQLREAQRAAAAAAAIASTDTAAARTRPSSRHAVENSATATVGWAAPGGMVAQRLQAQRSQEPNDLGSQMRAGNNAKHMRRYTADLSQQRAPATGAKEVHQTVIVVAPAASADSSPSFTVQPWYTHKSFFVASVSLLSGAIGCIWCLQITVRGAEASMNTDIVSLTLAILYLASLGVGRIKVQHQLMKLGVSMLSKGAGSRTTMAGLTPAQRSAYVSRFSLLLQLALWINALMFAIICGGLIILRIDPTTRHSVAVTLSSCIFTMTFVGPGSSYMLTTRILKTLKEHADAIAATTTQQQQRTTGGTDAGATGAAGAAKVAPTGRGTFKSLRRDQSSAVEEGLLVAAAGAGAAYTTAAHGTTSAVAAARYPPSIPASRGPSPTHSRLRSYETIGDIGGINANRGEGAGGGGKGGSEEGSSASGFPPRSLSPPGNRLGSTSSFVATTTGITSAGEVPRSVCPDTTTTTAAAEDTDDLHTLVRLQMQLSHSAAVSRANSRRQSRRGTATSSASIDFATLIHIRSQTPPPPSSTTAIHKPVANMGNAAVPPVPVHMHSPASITSGSLSSSSNNSSSSTDVGGLHYSSSLPNPSSSPSAIDSTRNNDNSDVSVGVVPIPSSCDVVPFSSSSVTAAAAAMSKNSLPPYRSRSASPAAGRRSLRGGSVHELQTAQVESLRTNGGGASFSSAAGMLQQQQQQSQPLSGGAGGTGNNRRGSMRPPFIPLPPTRPPVSTSSSSSTAATATATAAALAADVNAEMDHSNKLLSPSYSQLASPSRCAEPLSAGIAVEIELSPTAAATNGTNATVVAAVENNEQRSSPPLRHLHSRCNSSAGTTSSAKVHPQSRRQTLTFEGNSALHTIAATHLASVKTTEGNSVQSNGSSPLQQHPPSSTSVTTIHLPPISSHGRHSSRSFIVPALHTTTNASAAANGSASSVPSSSSSSSSSSDSLHQMSVWQSKLQALKKAMLPMLGTALVAILIVTLPWMSSHITISFPLTVIATNATLVIATKQLPTEFQAQIDNGHKIDT